MLAIEGKQAMSPSFEELDRRLMKKDIACFHTSSDNIGGDETLYKFYNLGLYTLRLSENIRDGLSCYVSDVPNAVDNDNNKWESIYLKTVEGFEKFDIDQQMEWVIDTPTGTGYVDMLEEHISKLL